LQLEVVGLSILDDIRNGCRYVAQQARYVRIDDKRIPGYARSLPLCDIEHPEIDPLSHYLGHGEDTVAFFFTLDTVNFGSGYFPCLTKRPGMSGYFTVAASLTDHFTRSGAFSARELNALSAHDCALIFGQDRDNEPIMELMALFSEALNDLGALLLKKYGGSFIALVETAGQSAETLVTLLAEMPCFRDVETYDGREIPFYKRAQLTAADLALAFKGKQWGCFNDLDRLTIFADNLVPHVLKLDGVLRYDHKLDERIAREELISAGSGEEVEIRACGLDAVERMVESLRQDGHDVTSMQLDYLLWNRGQSPQYKKFKPRHRTRTMFY